jgi:hypothetical protein
MEFAWPLRRATDLTSLLIEGAASEVLQIDPDQSKLNVFISYSRKDAPFAQRLAAALEKRWLSREEKSEGSGVDLLVRGQELADAELWLMRSPAQPDTPGSQ